jgi:hypothetical protein
MRPAPRRRIDEAGAMRQHGAVRARLLTIAALSLALGACGKGEPVSVTPDGAAGDGPRDRAPSDGRDAAPSDAKADAGETRDGYGGDGPCAPGVPRCHGDFGYQMCEQNGTYGESHSCAGYSSNGTTSYCADLPTDTGEPWATCIDPACWYWWKRGLLAKTPDGSSVGVCLPDGTLNKCLPGGTLMATACAGACTRVATLDGRALGFCAPACAEGARECVGGPFYRVCVGGKWDAVPRTCAGACNPLAKGTPTDIKCGGDCDPGTSRCRADGAAVELCTPEKTWALDRACTLGRCRPAGPQAECEAECLAGQRACAFDGDVVERRCDDAGRWAAESPCAAGTSCRVAGGLALGCVACAGADNAYGLPDSRCATDVATGDAGADAAAGAAVVETCGPANTWLTRVTCAANESCASISRGTSSLAACTTAP